MIITAAHIVDQYLKLIFQTEQYRARESEKAKIQAAGLNVKDQKKQLVKIGKLPGSHVTHCSAWSG